MQFFICFPPFFTVIVVLTVEQKEKLSEVEQQLKKAEAAQRRRMQVEKANRESEVCFCCFGITMSLHMDFRTTMQKLSVFELIDVG